MENKQIRGEDKKKKKKKIEPEQEMKVVYISNPMKLKTSATNFRSLVQELTGQHSVWPVDPSKYSSGSQYNNDDNISVSAADVSEPGLSTAEPSPDMSAGSSDPYSQPLDQDACGDEEDRVVLIDHHMLQYMLDDHHHYFSGSSRKNF